MIESSKLPVRSPILTPPNLSAPNIWPKRFNIAVWTAVIGVRLFFFNNRSMRKFVDTKRTEMRPLSVKQSLSIFALILIGSAGVTLAQNPNVAVKDTRYLALGDSVAFGYNPTVPISLRNRSE